MKRSIQKCLNVTMGLKRFMIILDIKTGLKMFECNYGSEKVYDHTRYQNRFKNFIRQSRQLLLVHLIY